MVPVVTGEMMRYANLDYAATSPCLAAVAEAVNEVLPWYASVHRGGGLPSVRCTDLYERARQTVQRFLGCRPDDIVIFVRNSTDAANLLASALPAETTVVAFEGEHHANLLTWRRSVVLPLPATAAQAVAQLDSALHALRQGELPPDATVLRRSDTVPGSAGTDLPDDRPPRTGPILVSITGASNVTGEVWPVPELAAVARGHDARVSLDAAQLVVHEPVDMAALGVDYLFLSGHKLYAPFGAGVLVGRADWLDQAAPYLLGGGAARHVNLAEGTVQWANGPARHEAGTPNLVGAVALARACELLLEADRAALVRHEQRLLSELDSGLAEIPGVHQLRIFSDQRRYVGISAFVLAHVPSSLLATALSAEYAVGVRDGLFCAHTLTRKLLSRVGDGRHSGAVRASVGIGTTADHIERLLTGVREIAENGPQWTYVERDGRLVPDPDHRDVMV
ncbi:MAG TPA: aminotransferase class V-fold PLP-dependent enzyme [Micromonosporaceae bacterium]